MGTRIDGSAIDKVLQEAVGTGAVPHVAAIAADRDGVIYEGGAGVRIAGESDDPVTTSTQFRIMSMTKMVVHDGGVAAGGTGRAGPRRPGRHLSSRVRRPAGAGRVRRR